MKTLIRKTISREQAREIEEVWIRNTPSPLSTMEWCSLPEIPAYDVSEYGHVRRAEIWGGELVPTMIKPRANYFGRLSYSLYFGKKSRGYQMSHVVLFAFKGPRPTPLHQGAHWDDNCVNNHVSNLRWATRIENEADRRRNGKITRGIDSAKAVLNDDKVRAIRLSTLTHQELSDIYGVGRSTIWQVRNGRTWKHVN